MIRIIALARACFNRTSFIPIPASGQPVSIQDDIVVDDDIVLFPPSTTILADIIDNDNPLALTPPSTTLIDNIPTPPPIIPPIIKKKQQKNVPLPTRSSTRGRISNKDYMNITTKQLQEVTVKLR